MMFLVHVAANVVVVREQLVQVIDAFLTGRLREGNRYSDQVTVWLHFVRRLMHQRARVLQDCRSILDGFTHTLLRSTRLLGQAVT